MTQVHISDDLHDGRNVEIARLRCRVEELERELGQYEMVPREWHLAEYERALLGLLMHRSQPVSKESIFTVLYGNVPESDWPELKIIDMWVHKLRAHLEVVDPTIEIETSWGFGYKMPKTSRERVRALLDQHASAA